MVAVSYDEQKCHILPVILPKGTFDSQLPNNMVETFDLHGDSLTSDSDLLVYTQHYTSSRNVAVSDKTH